VNVDETRVLTVRVLADDRAYWRNAKDPWARTDVKKLTEVFDKYKSDSKKIVLIQIDRESKFDNMVHIIDELDLAGLSRFSLGTLDDAGKKEVESL
jgi:biopolymer transport protein ExbD